MIRDENSGVDRQALVLHREERSYRSREFPNIEIVHETTSGAVEQQHPAGFVFKQDSCEFSLQFIYKNKHSNSFKSKRITLNLMFF